MATCAALALAVGACSSDGGSGASAPTGLGPKLSRLVERCEAEGDGQRPCYLGVSDLNADGGNDLETVPGTRAAASELCRALIDLDPTNDQLVDDRYVTVAWGRDYADVPPLKGVIFTEGDSHQLSVSVDVTPVDDEETRRAMA